MTTKEISVVVGKTERCVQGWAKKTGEKISSIGEKISSVQKTGIAADYSVDETCSIIGTGLGKNAASLFRENANKQNGNMQASTIAAIVAETIKQLIPLFQLQPKQEPKLIAPPIDPRDELRRIVNKAANESGDYSGTWKQLYTDSYYRLGVNIRERAKNRDMEPLDYAEQAGLIPDLLAIAKEIFA